MAFISFPGQGLVYPNTPWIIYLRNSDQASGLMSMAIDAASEKAVFIGYAHIDGRPSSAKTISSSGGKIHFRTGQPVTWSSSGTTVRVGIQDVTAASGPPIQPDGTFDVYDDLVQGTDSLSSNTWTTVTMSSGTKNIAHGDLIAVVFDMTVRNGSDAFRVATWGTPSGVTNVLPACVLYTTSWAQQTGLPFVVIEFDDGTVATLAGCWACSTIPTAETFQDSTNPDERGMILRLPFAAVCEGVCFSFENISSSAAADGTITLYSDPLGTPTSLASVTILGERTVSGARMQTLFFSSPVVLAANTDYCVALRSTGTSNFGIPVANFASATHKNLAGLSNCSKATRDGGSGAFSATTTTVYPVSFLLRAIDSGPAPTYQLGI
jgi:hypothetical protein